VAFDDDFISTVLHERLSENFAFRTEKRQKKKKKKEKRVIFSL